MISKILEIDGFGLFDGFKWDNDISDFKKYNVFYGWNYSGKTTLSRVFRSFEANQKHPDYPRCSSRILTDDGSSYDWEAWGCPHSIRVFNTDFVETNLKWDAQIEPILLIGEENIKLQEELTQLRDEQVVKRKELNKVSAKIESMESGIETKVTEKARHIKTVLSHVNYTKRNLVPVIKKICQDPHLQNDESVQKLIDSYRSTDKKAVIESISVSDYNLDPLMEVIRCLLETKIVSKTIQSLLDDPKLGDWVREGRDIHKGKDTCEFCGSALPFGLIDRLNDHFSDEFDRHLQALRTAIAEVESMTVDVQFVDEARFYQEITNEYSVQKKEARDLVSKWNENRNALIKTLNEKILNPFDSVRLPPLHKHVDISVPLNKINQIIDRHNEISDSFESRKKTSLDALEKHFASEFVLATKYVETMDEVSRLKGVVNTLESEIGCLESECTEIEGKLSEAAKGAEKVNEYLQTFWGRDDISLKINDKNAFQLHRGTILAKNLSEGEKTAISFAYFMTKLEEKGSDLSKTIVYIDDPISSLDSNHLFSTYSFIKNKLSTARQLFIATHNYEFLNLIKDWLTGKGKLEKQSSFYRVERCQKNGTFISCISNMPKVLKDFKSEYHYLFSIIYDFHINPKADFDKLYSLPNLARRLLEAYLGFKIPISAGLHTKLPDFMKDGIKEDKIMKFLDQYSHNNSLPRSLMFPDFGECKECIAIIVEQMQLVDPEHFNQMIEVVSGS